MDELYQVERPYHIPMSAPDLTDAEREAVLAVLNTPRLSMGPEVEGFEAAFVQALGTKHAIAVSSGTTGLHLCVCAAGIGAGDLVITTPFSFVASSNVLLYEGAVPVFVDVDPETGNIDPALIAQAADDLRRGGASARTWLPAKEAGTGELKAILPVDVFGQPADYDAIRTTAQAHGLNILEDSCEALGASYRDRSAGTLGDAGVFAFYPNKQITTGEGGMVITDREDWASRIRSLRNQGRAVGDAWLDHSYLGYNYRLDEMSAALGRIQMGRLDELLTKRERVAAWYLERLAEMPSVEPPVVVKSTTRMSWFVFVVRLPAKADRALIVERMQAQGIPSRPYFIPIHLQPYVQERYGYARGAYPVAEDLGARSLALPFSGVMIEEMVEQVCTALKQALETS